jgi:hypothetical protein
MKYKALFSIEFLHDYYNDGRGAKFVWLPTPACRQLLQDAGALYKVWNHELFVIVRVDDDDKPFKQIAENSLFEFYWQPIDPQFFGYTQIDFGTQNRFYFHNGSAHVQDAKKYLTAPPSLFASGNTFVLGQFVRNAGGTCFEAVRNLAAGSSLANGQQWANRGAVTYADTSSLKPCYGAFPILPVAPASPNVVIEVFTHVGDGQPAGVLVHKEEMEYEAPVTEHQLSWGSFLPGLYRVVVNGTDHIIYADPAREWYNHAGLVAIGHFTHPDAAFRLLDNDGVLLSPHYTVRFAPRSAIWRYQARTDSVKVVADETSAITFDETGFAQFTSRLPVRLRQEAYRHVMLEYNNTSPPDPEKTVTIKNLPVPNGSRLGTIRQNDTDYLLATTNLHY